MAARPSFGPKAVPPDNPACSCDIPLPWPRAQSCLQEVQEQIHVEREGHRQVDHVALLHESHRLERVGLTALLEDAFEDLVDAHRRHDEVIDGSSAGAKKSALGPAAKYSG